MKQLLILTALMLALPLAGAAQRQKTEPVGDPSPAQANPSRSSKSDRSNPLILTNTGLEATLTNSIDVRRSKVGDEVILKTTKSLKQDGAVVIPKGSRLIGRVTEVRQKGSGNAGSSIGLLFERIEGKGLSAPITASIVSITDARAADSSAEPALGEISGMSSTRTTASRGNSGGGLLGGVGSTVGGVVNSAAQTVGSVGGAAVDATGSAVSTAGGTLRGIQITRSAQASGSTSGTLTANGNNLKVEKGVNFNLLVSGSTQN